MHKTTAGNLPLIFGRYILQAIRTFLLLKEVSIVEKFFIGGCDLIKARFPLENPS